MYDTQLRYVAVAFVDAVSVKLNQKHIIEILQSVDFLELLPGQVQELTPSGPVIRPAFTTEDQISELVLLSNSFQYARISNNPVGRELGDFGEFCQQAGKIINTLSDVLHKIPHRLAVIREGFLQKQDSEIDAVAQMLLTLPPVYKSKKLNEWDWRASALVEREFGSLKEDTNTIGIIKRVNATRTLRSDKLPAPTEIISLIRVDMDINTSQLDLTPRFDSENITAFFSEATSWHKEFESELLNLITGGSENES